MEEKKTGVGGFEPPTSGSKGQRSTTELYPSMTIKRLELLIFSLGNWCSIQLSYMAEKSEWSELNRRPLGPHPSALPGCATFRKFKELKIGASGFEPLAFWSRTRCSTRLNYTPLYIWDGRT